MAWCSCLSKSDGLDVFVSTRGFQVIREVFGHKGQLPQSLHHLHHSNLAPQHETNSDSEFGCFTRVSVGCVSLHVWNGTLNPSDSIVDDGCHSLAALMKQAQRRSGQTSMPCICVCVFITHIRSTHALTPTDDQNEEVSCLVWYVVDTTAGASGFVNVRACEELFQDVPLIFVLNKVDMATPAELALARYCMFHEEMIISATHISVSSSVIGFLNLTLCVCLMGGGAV